MTGFDRDNYVSAGFDAELEDDVRFERALSRRCLYAVGIVVAVIVARAMWFI